MNANLKSTVWHTLSGASAALAWAIPVHGSFCIGMTSCCVLALTGAVSSLIGVSVISEAQSRGRQKAVGLAAMMILGSVCVVAPLVRWMDHRYFCLQIRAADNQILHAECAHMRECHHRPGVSKTTTAAVQKELRNGN